MAVNTTMSKPFKVSLYNLRIPILFKDCPLGVSERRCSRNEHSDSKNISTRDSQTGLRLLEGGKALKSSLFVGIEVQLPEKHIVSKIGSC